VIAMNRGGTKQAVLRAMRNEGEVLCLAFENGEPVWRLRFSGRRISSRTAQHIINSADVQPSDDALFPDAGSQTYTAR
jgi:hypothetical protein